MLCVWNTNTKNGCSQKWNTIKRNKCKTRKYDWKKQMQNTIDKLHKGSDKIEFCLLTEIGFHCSNYHRFCNVQAKFGLTPPKDGEVTFCDVFTTLRVFEQMLRDRRLLRCLVEHRDGFIVFTWLFAVKPFDAPGNVFRNSIAQSSHRLANIATITVASEMVNYHTCVVRGDAVFKTMRHDWRRREYHPWIDWVETFPRQVPYVLFHLVWSRSHIGKLDRDWAPSRANHSWLHHLLAVVLDGLDYQILRVPVVYQNLCYHLEFIVKSWRRTNRDCPMTLSIDFIRPSRSLWRLNKTVVYHFLMCLCKELRPTSWHPYLGNPLSRHSI